MKRAFSRLRFGIFTRSHFYGINRPRVNHVTPAKMVMAILLCALALRTPAAVYQQLPGQFGGFSSDGSTITVADDFQLGQDTLIGSIVWWGGYFNPAPGPDNFTVRLFADDGGQPGLLLDQLDFGPVNAVATGQLVNAPDLYPEYEYSASLPTPFLAQAGVKYWVSIVNPPRDIWLWEASASSLNPDVQRSFNGSSWEPYYDNTAFELEAVPEPSVCGFIFLGAGTTVLLLRRRSGVG